MSDETKISEEAPRQQLTGCGPEETPRTDAEVVRRNYGYDMIPAEFSRTLERELSQAKLARDELLMQPVPASVVITQLQETLSQAKAEIDSLRARVEELERERREDKRLLEIYKTRYVTTRINQLAYSEALDRAEQAEAESTRLRAELEEARKDAERYRWLRANGHAFHENWTGSLSQGLLDKAIDSAREKHD